MLDFLRERLTKWQVPDDVVFIDEVPKTSVGKFSKKTLRDKFGDLRAADRLSLTRVLRRVVPRVTLVTAVTLMV